MQWYFSILIGVGLAFRPAICHGELEVTPTAGIGMTYRFADRAASDWDAYISPGLAFRWLGPSGQIGFNYNTTVRADLDDGSWRVDDHHTLSLSTQAVWTPRFQTNWGGRLTVSPDTTRNDPEFSDVTDLLAPSTDTLHFDTNIGLSYQNTPLRQSSLGLFYGESRYDDPPTGGRPLHDDAFYGFSLSQSRQFTPKSSGQIGYRFTRHDLSDFGVHGLNLGYARSLSPTLSASLSSGVSYLSPERDFNGTWGASLSKAFQGGGLGFSASRTYGGGTGLTPSPPTDGRNTPPSDLLLLDQGNARSGGVFSGGTTTDSASLSGRWTLARSLEGTLRGGVSRNRALDNRNNRTLSYNAVAALHYRITSHWGGTLTYQHLQQRVEIDPSSTGDNRFKSDSISAQFTWRGSPWR